MHYRPKVPNGTYFAVDGTLAPTSTGPSGRLTQNTYYSTMLVASRGRKGYGCSGAWTKVAFCMGEGQKNLRVVDRVHKEHKGSDEDRGLSEGDQRMTYV